MKSPAWGIHGFSLTELIVVVALLSVLATIAIPNYRDYITRSRRSDGMIALLHLANEQRQFRSDWNTFTDNFTSLPSTNLSPDRYYEITIPTADATFFVVQAVPVGSQAGDGALRLSATGEQTWDQDNSGNFACSWDHANSRGC